MVDGAVHRLRAEGLWWRDDIEPEPAVDQLAQGSYERAKLCWYAIRENHKVTRTLHTPIRRLVAGDQAHIRTFRLAADDHTSLRLESLTMHAEHMARVANP